MSKFNTNKKPSDKQSKIKDKTDFIDPEKFNKAHTRFKARSTNSKFKNFKLSELSDNRSL